jgi:HD domain
VTISRLAHRFRQFWNALLNPAKRITSESLSHHLTPAQISLFRQIQPSEQVHAYQIFMHLINAGQTNPDLMAAALLHDVGKIRYPLSIFDRVLTVLGKRIFRDASKRWAAGTPHGLRMPFVVAERHAEWGAALASQAGATSRTVELIRHHHDLHLPDPGSQTRLLLAALQAADDES